MYGFPGIGEIFPRLFACQCVDLKLFHYTRVPYDADCRERMLVNFIPKKAQNARMLVDVGHGAMEGAPANLARMSSYDTLGPN